MRLAHLRQRWEHVLRLRDWPLTLKFAAAPGVMLVLFAVASSLSLGALLFARQATNSIVQRDMRLVVSLGEISARFDHEDGNLYRLLVDKAAGGRTIDIPKRSAEITSRLGRIRRDLIAIRPSLAPGDQARMTRVLAQIDRYSDAVEVVSSMLDVDFTASAAMLAPFRANAGEVLRDVNRMAQTGVDNARHHAAVAAARTRALVIIVTVAMVLLATVGLLVPLVVGRATVRSVREIADVTAAVAAGRHDVDLGAYQRADELNQIVEALKFFRVQAVEKEMLERDAIEEDSRRGIAVAAANLRNERERAAMLNELVHTFEVKVRATIDEAEGAMARLNGHARELDQTVADANRLASGLEQIAEVFVQEMFEAGNATDALTAAIRLIDDEAKDSSRIATAILERALRASREVDASERQVFQVERIIDVIDGIARQTNLLALNATIEAARSGEAGRGFAVVAKEIKALSGSTHHSTTDVRKQIHTVQDGVRRVVSETAELSALIEQMDSIAARVSETSSDQARSTGLIDERIEAVRVRVQSLPGISASIRDAARQTELSTNALRTDGAGIQMMLNALSEDAKAFSALVKNRGGEGADQNLSGPRGDTAFADMRGL